ncbi:hypothetical protein TrST_g12881 [Triparma strigata]|uniref:Uncharacterized protein n=1 Tax=Triparma strigata TaxID=1606541 RepID=A0A9W6ZZK6_9STRA|nr:hypothetical protein TrST_g12881 [Triparma strigata]
MGAGASVIPPVNTGDEVVGVEGSPKIVGLKELPDAIEECVYTEDKWPFVIDPDGDASRFLKYQRGSFLLGSIPPEMEKTKLRKLLVGCLKNGSNMTVKYRTMENGIEDLTRYFEPGFFPAEILEKVKIMDETCWAGLLRQDEGDPPVHEFGVMDSFVFMVVIEEVGELPPEVHNYFSVIQVGGKKQASDGGGGEDDAVEAMFGAKEIKKNSKDLVEFGFDGELDEIKALVDKGYHIDSEDGRGHTALSEAASQGQNHVIDWLLSQGADPNMCNDQDRSPMYRAAFNGHSGTIQLLLEAGADREILDKSSGERPYDVAKDEATRECIGTWDYSKTEALMEERKKAIMKKLEERIRTAADREALARMLITKELCDKTIKGDVEGLKSQLIELADEADRSNRRPITTCEARNERGQTLLSLACQYGKKEVVELLLNHKKNCEEGLFLDPGEHSWEYRVFSANANSREQKGWNIAAIATFHGQKNILRMILNEGGDPTVKNSYNMSALDHAKDELDAAMNVVTDRSEIRSVLVEWDAGQGSSLFGTGKFGLGAGGDVAAEEPLPKDGTAIEMQLEMQKEDAAKKEMGAGKGKGGKKKKGGTGKAKLMNAKKKLSTVSKANAKKKK